MQEGKEGVDPTETEFKPDSCSSLTLAGPDLVLDNVNYFFDKKSNMSEFGWNTLQPDHADEFEKIVNVKRFTVNGKLWLKHGISTYRLEKGKSKSKAFSRPLLHTENTVNSFSRPCSTPATVWNPFHRRGGRSSSQSVNRAMNPWALHLQKLGLELKCSLCLNLFKRPLLMPCDHLFCDTCIARTEFCSECPICKDQSADRVPFDQVCEHDWCNCIQVLEAGCHSCDCFYRWEWCIHHDTSNGKWILNINWVKECLKAMHPLSEEPYS
ncbi:uncharacterized protein LOC120212252 [Hibiscus syriacus]|uniref:uncharacterized protein LOC120212252 n=1 Tax=Hibiscus syriacus TaxID=106335 RepID=UPI0019239C6A|nr:uncharacterized protein LOC120212252 [Hibiscus syriacus]